MTLQLDLPQGIHATTLDNGVTVVTEPMPDVRSVSVGFWIDVGSRDEAAPVEGASHFLEHLLFKGTPSRSAIEIAEVMDRVGGDMNAFTTKEHTCFYARCLDRDLPAAVDVLGDMLCRALLDPTDVDAERQVVLEEIRMHHDDPDDLVHSVFAEAWYGDHPLGREVLGTARSISDMARDDIAAWFKTHYAARNMLVVVAGNARHDEVVRLVQAALAELAQGGIHPARAPHSGERARAVEVVDRPTEQVHLLLGGRGYPRNHEQRFAVSVLNQALGGGMASRLFQEVREKRGLAYSVYSYPLAQTDSGAFIVYAGTGPDSVGELVDVLRSELERLRKGGLTAEELERAKGNLAGSSILALEDTSSRMSRIGRSLLSGVPVLSLDDLLGRIESVSAHDVDDVAWHLTSGPFSVAAVGPLRDEALLAAAAEPLP